MNWSLGAWLIAIGLIVAGLGAVLMFAPKLLSWFGNLPGDIRIVRDGFRLHIPLASMLLVSLGLTLLARVIGWLLTLR